MNLVPYIFILIPSVIGVRFYNKLAKKGKFDLPKYFIYVFLSNLITIGTLGVVYKFNDDLFAKFVSSTSFAIKYSILMLILNLIFGFIDFVLYKFFDLEVEETYEKKNSKNK